MSATRMKVEAGRLAVEADQAGRILAVAARGRPDRRFLTAVDLGACRVDGVEVGWSGREVAQDADEISVRLTGVDLEVELRHSFTAGWTTRLLIMNTGTVPRAVDRLQLTARIAPGQRVSALAAGARLCWAVQAADGAGPLLAARLVTGAVTRVTGDGFELGPLRLAAGQRYVTQLRWELFATPRSVVAGPGRDVLVSRTAYEVDEAILLPADPDAALVVPRGVAVDPVEDADVVGREVYAVAPGRYRIELRSADGDIRLDLSWVAPLTEQLESWAAAVLSRPRTAAGVVAVDDLPAAVVLQTALGAGQLDDADQACDALDRLTASLLDRSMLGDPSQLPDGPPEAPVDPLAVLFLLGEHGRTGDRDVLDLALSMEADLLTDRGRPPPAGLGLAVLRTVLAGVDAHDRVAPLVLRAVERASALTAPPDLGPPDLGPPDTAPQDLGQIDTGQPEAGEQAAELELLLAVRPLLPPDQPANERLTTLVQALGAALGAGLPGRLVAPPPVAEHAHLVAVLRMLPEDGVLDATRSWGASPSLLAHRLTLELLDRLVGSERPHPQAGGESPVEIGPAAAWLALVQRHA